MSSLALGLNWALTGSIHEISLYPKPGFVSAGRRKGHTSSITAVRRNLATTAATGQAKFQATWTPLPDGFRQVDFNDLDALKAATSAKTATRGRQSPGGSPETTRGSGNACRRRGEENGDQEKGCAQKTIKP